MYFILIRILSMKNMFFQTPTPSILYNSTVRQYRAASSSAYQKRFSHQFQSQFQTSSHLPTSFLNNRKKQDYKFNVVVAPAQRIESQAVKYQADNFTKTHLFQQTHQSKSANKYEDAKYNQNTVHAENLQKEGNFAEKEVQPQRPRRSSESNSSINQIMQKLHKKEQLIKELQKICDKKVSDNIRKSSQDKYKIDGLIGSIIPKNNSSSSKVDKVKGYPFSGANLEDLGSTNFDLTLSTISSRNKRDANFSYLKQFETTDKMARKESDSTPAYKNPEEAAMTGVQRIQCSNWLPREYLVQNLQQKNKDRLKMQIDKVTSSFQIPYLEQNQIYSSKKNNNSFHYIQVRPPSLKYQADNKNKAQESLRDRKNAKDIRNIMQTRNLQKKSSYFANKKVGIADFVLKKTLGQGKFGAVYQAFHTQTKTLFALKRISKKVIKSNLMVDQLLQEIKIQFLCNHENILKIYGFFDDSQFIYLILEYMQQGTLFSILKKEKKLPEKDAAVKLNQIAKAIVYLQQNGIVHRDIKPQNIVMTNGVGKLCDFGWAAICTDRRKTYCGTFDYVAPEILQGNQYDTTVDLWCLGVMAYELMVGKAPFYHISRKQTMKKIMNVQKTALEFPAHLSKNAVSFIESLIKKNPEQRLNGLDILKHPFLVQIRQPDY